MQCKSVKKWLLSDYIDGECSASVSSAMEKHLTHCPACRAEYEKIKKITLEPFIKESAATAPEGVWEATERRVDAFERKRQDQDFGFVRLGYALEHLNMRFPKFFRKRVAFVIVIVCLFALGGLFTFQHSPYRQQVWEGQKIEAFDYILTRTQMDVYEQEKGFGTSIEEMFL